jgi:hypothetical protein
VIELNGSHVNPVDGVTWNVTAPVVAVGAATVIVDVPATFTLVLTGFGIAVSVRPTGITAWKVMVPVE